MTIFFKGCRCLPCPGWEWAGHCASDCVAIVSFHVHSNPERKAGLFSLLTEEESKANSLAQGHTAGSDGV